MTKFSVVRILAITLVVALFTALPAAAQATRTWVSGVGDDANPCSRTAPCKTFAGAISKTAAGGEISVLDPGGFGAVTITKSITISGDGTLASILAAGTNGVIVNVAATDRVVLRNLSIEGAGTGLNGIRFIGGGSLFVEQCTIGSFTQKGIDFQPATAGTHMLSVSNSAIRNNATASTGGGVFVKPGVSANAVVAMANVRLERNVFGLRVEDRSKVTVRDSTAFGNVAHGFITVATAAAAEVTLHDCVATMSAAGTGVRTTGALARVRITGCTITGNAIGLDLPTGNVASWGNNYVLGNTIDGLPSELENPL
jgi:hypothetical protein